MLCNKITFQFLFTLLFFDSPYFAHRIENIVFYFCFVVVLLFLFFLFFYFISILILLFIYSFLSQ